MSDPEYIAPARPVPRAELVATLDSGTKVKRRIPRMRACDERNDKDKPCHGHLKHWYDAPEDLKRQFGPEIYRCEHCHTLYLPNLDEQPRTATLAW